jgi:hypothetical protein
MFLFGLGILLRSEPFFINRMVHFFFLFGLEVEKNLPVHVTLLLFQLKKKKKVERLSEIIGEWVEDFQGKLVKGRGRESRRCGIWSGGDGFGAESRQLEKGREGDKRGRFYNTWEMGRDVNGRPRWGGNLEYGLFGTAVSITAKYVFVKFFDDVDRRN